MALELDYIVIDRFASDSDGDLVTTGHKIRYVVRDTVNTDLKKGGELDMDTITPGDTVTVWWGKVKTQVETAEGI
jgi:hypothetical protein